MNLLTT